MQITGHLRVVGRAGILLIIVLAVVGMAAAQTTEPDTTALTEDCSASQYLGGDGTCKNDLDTHLGTDYGALVNRSGGSANSMTGNLDLGSNNINNLINTSSPSGVTRPSLTLHSSSNNDIWTEQGAYISIGESGALGSASMHMTYRGDGYGFVGAGSVSNAAPSGGSYFRFDYNVNNILTNAHLNMNSNKLEGLQSADSGDDAMRRDDAIGTFVDEGGDTMTGNLDLNGNRLQNVDWITPDGDQNIHIEAGGNDDAAVTINKSLNSPDEYGMNIFMDGDNDDDIPFEIRAAGNGPTAHNRNNTVFMVDGDGDTAIGLERGLDIRPSQSIANQLEVGGTIKLFSGGNLDVSGNSIVNFFGSACGAGQAVQDVADGGGFTCINVRDTASDVWVNESGDTMSGDLDMGANQLHTASFLHGTQGGIADSLTTAQNNVPAGNSFYVQDDLKVGGDIVGASGDVAEKVPTDDTLEKGEVAVIADNMSLAQASEPYSTDVAGIISTDPSYVLAANRDGKPLALSGIVPTKVVMENGEIAAGDLLTTSSTPGAAMKCADRAKCQGAVIGKAMEAATSNAKIRVLVTLG